MKRYIIFVLLGLWMIKAIAQEVKVYRLAEGARSFLPLGDMGEVRLQENGNTGYEWEVEIQGKNLELWSDERDDAGDAWGSSYARTWRFRSTETGTSKLIFRYFRSWEGAENAIQTLEYEVIVGHKKVQETIVSGCRELAKDEQNICYRGEFICVNLPVGSDTTQAYWQVHVSPNNALELISSKYLVDDVQKNSLHRVWRYKVRGEGICELRFREVQKNEELTEEIEHLIRYPLFLK